MKKVVLITGSSRGIGEGIAEVFAKGNYKIVLNCKNNIEKMEELKKRLIKINPDIIGIQCDVSKYDEVKKMFEKIKNKFGTVDILINNAGISYYGLFNEMEEKNWQEVINVNLMSVINCSRIGIESMIKNKTGEIINISSMWGDSGSSCEVIYSTSKAGVDGFTKALAKEVGPSNVKVNAIACGLIDTEMNNNLTISEKNDIIDSVPLGKIGKPIDVGQLCLFLASEDNKYITGQVIKVDGGFI